MRVTTLLIIVAVIAAGVWFAHSHGYFGKAGEAADSFSAHYAKGNKLYFDMKYDEALTEYQAARKRDPNHENMPVLLRRMGDCYKEKGEPDKAIAHYEEMVEKYPDHKMANDTRNAIEKVRSMGHY